MSDLVRVRRGHSPNCSSAGSVVGVALISAVAGAAVLNAYAGRLARWAGRAHPSGGSDAPPEGRGAPPPPEASPPPDGREAAPDGREAPPPDVRVRQEAHGALVAWPDPPALLELTGAAAAAALAAGRRVGAGEAVPGALSAPTEVHVAITSKCPVRCTGCYLSAGPDRGADADLAALQADLERLAAQGVMEVAVGGGEAVLRDELIALLRHARGLGLVPNLTTSGFGVTAARARLLSGLVGQVNVSLDGLATYTAVRGWDGVGTALAAIRHLRAAGVRVGVNTVLTRANLDELDPIADALLAEGVEEWQWLRFKPAGRGVGAYADLALSSEQALSLWPRALAIEARGLRLRWDCAMVPFLAAHAVPVDAAARLGVTGCAGGHSLLARSADGAWHPCSFAPSGAPGDPAEAWRADPTLLAWRERAASPPAPCSTCDWRDVCRGGCRVVAAHVTGDPLAPDPECPRVLAAG